MSAPCLLASSPFARWTLTSCPRHAAASGGNVEYRPVPALTHSLVQWPSLHVVERDENACFSAGAFLISTPDTYGYSPYSRKLGHWCSRTNLMNAGAFGHVGEERGSRCASRDVTTWWPEHLAKTWLSPDGDLRHTADPPQESSSCTGGRSKLLGTERSLKRASSSLEH